MKSSHKADNSKVFKYHDFTEEAEIAKPADNPSPYAPFLFFRDEDLILKKGGIGNDERAAEAEEDVKPEENPEEPEAPPISEAERLIVDAMLKSEEIIRQSEEEAERIIGAAEQRAAELFAEAKDDGYGRGHELGVSHGVEVGMNQFLTAAAEKYGGFFGAVEKARENLEAQKRELLRKNLDDLGELALTIAEKIVCVSLSSSGEVIKKMILSAASPVDERQWAKIMISAQDAEMMESDGIDIRKELNAVSDKIELVTVDGAVQGTCLVEFPDQVTDAGAVIQLRNIKSIISSSD